MNSVGSYKGQGGLLRIGSETKYIAAEGDHGLRAEVRVGWWLREPVSEGVRLELLESRPTDIIDQLHTHILLDVEVRLTPGQWQLQQRPRAEQSRFGSNTIRLVIGQSITYTVQVHTRRMGTNMGEGGHTMSSLTLLDQVINEFEERTSSHPHPLPLVCLMMIGPDGQERCEAV